jgi:hypothetical protein
LNKFPLFRGAVDVDNYWFLRIKNHKLTLSNY